MLDAHWREVLSQRNCQFPKLISQPAAATAPAAAAAAATAAAAAGAGLNKFLPKLRYNEKVLTKTVCDSVNLEIGVNLVEVGQVDRRSSQICPNWPKLPGTSQNSKLLVNSSNFGKN